MKKIIDEHGRVFGKVSIIDFFVVLIVLAIGTALYIKFNVLEVTSVTVKTDKITYAVNVSGVRQYTVDSFKVGDVLYDKNGSGGNSIGTIMAINVSDAKKISETVNGTVVMGNYLDRYDVSLTVTAAGSLSNGRYLVNKTYELNEGSIRSLYSKYCAFEATIAEIS